jgi:EAL domain-containing protein (putative c-di-GMP-specific phosphodiesterase class I)
MAQEPKFDYFLLRAEWLKYKSNLFDKNTNLPTVPIVIDDARKIVEEHGCIGLMLIDIGRQKNFEPTYGWQVYDEIIKEFSTILEETRGEVLQSKDFAAISHIRGDSFLLFLNPPPGKSWTDPGLEIINERVRNCIDRKLERFNGHRWHANFVFHTGYASVMRDPTIRIERLIERAIERAREMSGQQLENEMIRSYISLQKIISQGSIVIYFQPIVSLLDLDILGYEALTRGPEESGFEDPELLFSYAENTNLILELERLCRRNALKSAQALRLDRKLFLNSSPRSVLDSDFTPDHIAELVSELGLDKKNIVLEITERIAIQEWDTFKKVLRQFRSHGFKIAVDDIGAGYSSLQAIAELEPDFLKFDVSLVRNINESLIKRGLLETLVALSHKIKALLIAEGVETKQEFQTLRSLGVSLGQGYYFASPALKPATALVSEKA